MNTAGLVTPATVAVAVNVPAVVFASNRGEVATPDASVVSVACVLPPGKLAPALPAPDPDAPAPPPPPPEPRLKVTLTPSRGAPVASVSFTWSARPYRVPTVADSLRFPTRLEQGRLAGEVVELEARRLGDPRRSWRRP